jgi:hypothetical protein
VIRETIVRTVVIMDRIIHTVLDTVMETVIRPTVTMAGMESTMTIPMETMRTTDMVIHTIQLTTSLPWRRANMAFRKLH